MAAKIRSNKNITPVPNLKFSLEFFFYLFTLHIFGHNILKSADRHLVDPSVSFQLVLSEDGSGV